MSKERNSLNLESSMHSKAQWGMNPEAEALDLQPWT